ncbi:hypothetical protein [Variovorax sp. PAMC26660]|uniref:hypothetical protein n=1 Tax=Variovorax sp. PAMC26660 TaxID=2762322 RepID=UPI00164D69B0|nr:hypothetical protein [Variovorax sp. PAMC26660]QNK66086.1 hypothetical protein H7F35_23180 [Variovorax sp. PAMC26660]
MKLWNAFLRDVRPSAPTTPEPVLEHAILRAAQEFCQRTRAWVVEFDPTITSADATEYDMELPAGTELVRIESASLDGHPFAVWRRDAKASGRYVFTPDGRTLRFSQRSTDGQSLVLTCSVKPGEGAKGIDDVVFARYVTVIALGAVAGITGDAAKQGRFEAKCDDIVFQLWKGNAATRQRTEPSFF